MSPLFTNRVSTNAAVGDAAGADRGEVVVRRRPPPPPQDREPTADEIVAAMKRAATLLSHASRDARRLRLSLLARPADAVGRRPGDERSDLGATAGNADRRHGVPRGVSSDGRSVLSRRGPRGGRGDCVRSTAIRRLAELGRLRSDEQADGDVPQRPRSEEKRRRQLDARRRHHAIGDAIADSDRRGVAVQERRDSRRGADRARGRC